MMANVCPSCRVKHYSFWALCAACQKREQQAAGARAVAEAMEASTAACTLMDHYQLVLQRTAELNDISRVRAIGPGAAGQPSDWKPTTADAVADWVAKHAARYNRGHWLTAVDEFTPVVKPLAEAIERLDRCYQVGGLKSKPGRDMTLVEMMQDCANAGDYTTRTDTLAQASEHVEALLMPCTDAAIPMLVADSRAITCPACRRGELCADNEKLLAARHIASPQADGQAADPTEAQA
jgi:hypothetical protein